MALAVFKSVVLAPGLIDPVAEPEAEAGDEAGELEEIGVALEASGLSARTTRESRSGSHRGHPDAVVTGPNEEKQKASCSKDGGKRILRRRQGGPCRSCKRVKRYIYIYIYIEIFQFPLTK